MIPVFEEKFLNRYDVCDDMSQSSVRPRRIVSVKLASVCVSGRRDGDESSLATPG